MPNSPGGKVNAANLNIEGLNPEPAVVGTDVVILGRTGQANRSAKVSQLGGGGGVPDPLLLNDGDATDPTYAYLAEPDTGIFRVSAGRLGFTLSGGLRWLVEIGRFASDTSFGGALNRAAASAIIPGPTFTGDENTGIGRALADALSHICGGQEGLRLAEIANHVIQTNHVNFGLTASVTQTQAGGLALISSYNEIATVANLDDTVVAPTVTKGQRLLIINNGANTLQVFPFLGDDIGAGVDAAIFIASGAIGKFIGQTAALWDTLFNSLPSPSGGAGTANDAVQARRTTTLDLTTAFVDVTLDATDVETDSAVIEHDVITDRIEVKVNGTYEISYQFDNDSATIATSSAEIDARVRLNDAGTDMNGSLSLSSIHRTGGGQAAVMPQSVCISFIADLSANDFVTLQVQKRDIVLTETWFINNVSVKVKRLL